MKRIVCSVFLAFCSLSTACEDDSSQPNARDRAVEAACERYDECGAISASGGMYVSKENCRVKQSLAWESQWPPGECDGRVNGEQLDLCINSIETAECGATFDIINIVFNKCPKSKVCTGPTK